MDEKDQDMVPSRRRYRVARRSAKPWRQELRLSRRGNLSSKYTTHSFRRALELTALGPGTTRMGYTFSLSNLINASELTVLYDQYKIQWVEVKAIPSQINADVSVGTQTIPALFVAVDTDDASTPASYSEILEHADHKIYQMDKMKTIARFSPRPQAAMYRSSVATGYSTPNKPVWLDCANADIPHYGLKVVAEPMSANHAGIRVVATVYFQMKNSR